MDPSAQSSSSSSSSSSVDQSARSSPRCRKQQGRRWLYERVAVVVGTVVAILVMAVVRPKVQQACLNRNESAAIATLKSVSSGQSQMQASGLIDVDGNGQGEYGFFAELAGTVPLRGQDKVLATPVLPSSFGNVVNGRVQRSGYWFQMFLPGVDDGWARELATGGSGNDINSRESEVLWMCYAWPVDQGASGNRAFFINQSGDVLASNEAHEAYGGTFAPVAGVSAFDPENPLVVAANRMDARGTTWVVT